MDEGGASLEGLQVAAELFEPVYVFHDPGPRTFHPKLYVTESATSAAILLGSGNLTKGGLFTNYEAALEIEIDKADDGDTVVLTAVRAYFESLVGAGDACQKLDADLIQHLSEVAVITSEAEQNRSRARRRRSKHKATRFGTTVTGLANAPEPQVAAVADDDVDEDVASRLPTPDEEPVDDTPAVDLGPTDVVALWWKRLSASDAQHPPSSASAPTGNLRLSKAGHPIDWRTYFRRDFFGSEQWRKTQVSGHQAEEASVRFDVVLGGQSLGEVDILIDYATHREADQNNVPTVLHWGALGEHMRATDFTGFYVVLSKLGDGSFVSRSRGPRRRRATRTKRQERLPRVDEHSDPCAGTRARVGRRG